MPQGLLLRGDGRRDLVLGSVAVTRSGGAKAGSAVLGLCDVVLVRRTWACRRRWPPVVATANGPLTISAAAAAIR
ncbi:hypothetical protein SGRIM128S_01593 [Streptomyces griseomycini]